MSLFHIEGDHDRRRSDLLISISICLMSYLKMDQGKKKYSIIMILPSLVLQVKVLLCL